MGAVADRDRSGRAGLLAGQSEVADEHGFRGVAEVVDLRHAPRAPARWTELRRLRLGEVARDQVGDSGVTFPPVLVRRREPRDHRAHLLWSRRVGDVPHLVARAGPRVAERPQEVALAPPVAHARHLRPALLGATVHPRDVGEVARPRGDARWPRAGRGAEGRSEEHTSELQSLAYLVCRLLLEKK